MAVIVQSTLNSDMLLNYTNEGKDGLRRYTLNAYLLSFYYGQNVCCTFTSDINDYYYYYYLICRNRMREEPNHTMSYRIAHTYTEGY